MTTNSFCGATHIFWEEIWYFPTAASKYTKTDTIADRMSLKGKCNPDSDLLASLTADTGPLAAGAMPALDMGNIEGQKSMCESLAGGSVTKAKPKKAKNEQPAEEVVPATVKETGTQSKCRNIPMPTSQKLMADSIGGCFKKCEPSQKPHSPIKVTRLYPSSTQ